MSATHVEPASTPFGSETRHEPTEVGVLYVTDVPRPVLRALSVLGAAQDMSRSGYVRELVGRHTLGGGDVSGSLAAAATLVGETLGEDDHEGDTLALRVIIALGIPITNVATGAMCDTCNEEEATVSRPQNRLCVNCYEDVKASGVWLIGAPPGPRQSEYEVEARLVFASMTSEERFAELLEEIRVAASLLGIDVNQPPEAFYNAILSAVDNDKPQPPEVAP